MHLPTILAALLLPLAAVAEEMTTTTSTSTLTLTKTITLQRAAMVTAPSNNTASFTLASPTMTRPSNLTATTGVPASTTTSGENSGSALSAAHVAAVAVAGVVAAALL